MLLFDTFSLYGAVYVSGFALFWLLLVLQQRFTPLTALFYAVYGALGAVVGARLTYICLYAPHYYLEHPEAVFKLYQGGMAFHGALAGLLFALWAVRSFKADRIFWQCLDAAALCALITLPLGRLCNFFNGELYGRVTDSPLGVIFLSADLRPRWPSQLFEAAAEGPLCALALWQLKRRGLLHRPGLIACAFAALYALLRFILEFWREPDAQLGLLGPLQLTMGQYLCALQFAAALTVFLYLYRQGRPAA